MNATATPPAQLLEIEPVQAPEADESTTRERVLALIASAGPVAAAELATQLELTPAGIRRHLGGLAADGQIAVHVVPSGKPQRGRPARHYVATERGQGALTDTYSHLATDALRYLAQAAGPQAVQQFAAQRGGELEQRYAGVIAAAGDDPTARVQALAGALAGDGYAATARPVPGGVAVQLCQGHCPVQQVAAEFPALCDAETQAFSRLLGVHVQRLSTLASGGHVCTTNVPTHSPTHLYGRPPGDRSMEGMR